MLTALLSLFFLFAPDCSSEGARDMRETYRETLKLMDQIERERLRGGLTDEAIELRAELREKQDEMREWFATCRPVLRRRVNRE